VGNVPRVPTFLALHCARNNRAITRVHYFPLGLRCGLGTYSRVLDDERNLRTLSEGVRDADVILVFHFDL
jgi:hypothetical protein